MQVVDSPGARVVTGQDATGAVPVPVNVVSFTATLDMVTFPVLVTRNEYVTVSPAAVIVDGVADFTTVSAGAAVTVTVAVEGGETTGPPFVSVPVTVAVFVIDPASTSACVAEYVAVQVTDAPGASEAAPAGHDTTGAVPVPVNAVSFTPALVIVTLPVFVIKNEYVTVSPALVTWAGVADFTKARAGFCAAGTST